MIPPFDIMDRDSINEQSRFVGNATPSVAWVPVIDALTDPVMVNDAMLSIVLDGKRTIICPFGLAI